MSDYEDGMDVDAPKATDDIQFSSANQSNKGSLSYNTAYIQH